MKTGSSSNNIKRDILKVLSTNLIVAIMGFINSFIFPKIMSIDDYAIYHTFTLYLSYIAIFHLGFPNGLMIKYAGKNYLDTNKNEYKSETYVVLLILSFFTSLFLILYLFTNNQMILFVCLAIIPVDYLGSIKALWQAWGLFNKYSRVNSIIAISIPFFALIFYVIFRTLPGYTYITLYLIVNWLVFIFILKDELKFTKNVKQDSLLSQNNLVTEKIGFGFLLGNYINTLFTSADKQFVKVFFQNTEFAFYSFGMSMQALMTVFITSLAQPLFPMMAKKNMGKDGYTKIKNLLFVFGSFSGCAYFFASFVVKHFIVKYIPSLDVIKIYFLVFPAMAVVNCLYINLYKIENKMKEYIITLICILFFAVTLNYIFVKYYHSYTGVAIATTITYYIWMIIGMFNFKKIRFTFKDFGFLIMFFVGFARLTKVENDILGCLLYFAIFLTIAFLFYSSEMKILFGHYLKIVNGRK